MLTLRVLPEQVSDDDLSLSTVDQSDRASSLRTWKGGGNQKVGQIPVRILLSLKYPPLEVSSILSLGREVPALSYALAL